MMNWISGARRKTSAGGKNVNDKLLDEYGYEVAERAAILEFEAGMSREEAERVAVKAAEKETK
jgi:hypothetical protein